jgi:hypothetical protein
MIYEPVLLCKAVDTAVKAKEERKEKLQDISFNAYYKELFKKMAAQAKDARRALGLRYCLTRREFALLLNYYLTEANEEEFKALTPVILEDVDEVSSMLLYDEILKSYDEEKIITLAESLKNKKTFGSVLKTKLNLQFTEFLEAVTGGSLPEYINNIAGIISGGEGSGYGKALEGLHVKEEYKLYKECGKLYLFVCDAAGYLTMGLDTLSKLSEGFDEKARAELLKNMLSVMDSYQLRHFVPMIDFFAEAVGTPGSDKYERAFEGYSKAITGKYDVLINQRSIYKAFGGGERADFWYGYIDKCKIYDLEKLGALVFIFENFVCIEPYIEDAAYFYDLPYYNETVKQGSAGKETPEDFFAYLKNKTEWAAEGERPKRWRRAHTGSWQLDYKKHISMTLKS